MNDKTLDELLKDELEKYNQKKESLRIKNSRYAFASIPEKELNDGIPK